MQKILSLYLEDIDMRIDAAALYVAIIVQLWKFATGKVAFVVTFKYHSKSFFWSQEYPHVFVNVSSNGKWRTNILWSCFSVSFSKAPSIKLPSSVFATEFEEDVGLLNKAAPVSGIFYLSIMWVAI